MIYLCPLFAVLFYRPISLDNMAQVPTLLMFRADLLFGGFLLIRWITLEAPAAKEISRIKVLLRMHTEWVEGGSDFCDVIDYLVGALHVRYIELVTFFCELGSAHLWPCIDAFL